MASQNLTTPGAGYVTNDRDTEARLIAMGVKPVSTDSMTQTKAVAYAMPGKVVKGAVTGSTPAGQGIESSPTQIQAIAGVGSAQNQAVLDTWAKRDREAAEAAARSNGSQTSNPSGALPAAPTAGQVYSGLVSTGDPELDAAYAAQQESLKQTQAPIDEASIRENTLRKFQTEIDALNSYYATVRAERINAEEMLNKGRLGSGASIQARRGLLGSDFGQAQTDTINQKSNEIKTSIGREVDSERNAAVQALMGKARQDADAEIAAKRAAKEKGATDYISFLQGAAERKVKRVDNAIANLIAGGLETDENALTELSKQLGLDLSDLKTKLKQYKASAATEAAKNAPKLTEIGGVGYERQADGSYKAVTPTPEEKPLVVGGAAYLKNADGTYRMVTPKEEPKPINRVVNKVLQVSLDGGKTWAPAGRADGSSTPVSGGSGRSGGSSSGTTTVTPVTNTKVINQALNEIQTGIGTGVFYNENGNQIRVGSDGKVSPQDYLTLRNAWVKKGFSPTTFDTKMKGYRDANNDNYAVGK